jgi:hypothetical protein
MLRYFATAATGWLGVIALGFGAILPFLLRRTALSRATGMGLVNNQPYLLRMWPHYWFGYVVTGLSALHAMLPMTTGRTSASPKGLWFATVALGILWTQIWSGLLLRGSLAPTRRARLRRFHFWSMAACVALIVLHILTNG